MLTLLRSSSRPLPLRTGTLGRLYTVSNSRAIMTTASRAIANPLPATFVRGGTSKGIFINAKHLPHDRNEWTKVFLGIMGSPDPEHGRQLNGMGGGVSSLSKICVVGPSEQEGVDAEYTFVQVGIRDSTLDYAGNCGNLSSVIGVFAVDEGICAPTPAPSPSAQSTATVRTYNTNTAKLVQTTFPVSSAGVPVLDLPEAEMAGVPGLASRISLEFLSPAGARTGELLPSGSPTDVLAFSLPSEEGREETIEASLVDATNPTVFVLSADLSRILALPAASEHQIPIPYGTPTADAVLERIRRAGATKMGLDPAAQAQPKIAVLSEPAPGDDGVDIVIHALSMGVLHRAVPGTVGLCLGVAARTPGTLAHRLVSARPRPDTSADFVRMRHPSGVMDVGATFGARGEVVSAKVVRTGRRLMRGEVWW